MIDYIAAESPLNAAGVLEKIEARAQKPERYPNRGRVVPELQSQGITYYREVIIAPWRLIYRISDKTAYIVSFLDSRQNVEDILLRRLTR